MLAPAVALAQAASPTTETELQQEMRHRRVIVRPATPPDQVERDAERAAAEIQDREREQAVARDLTRPAQRPPQSDQDLKGGIQTRRLDNLLPRR
jgi:hypothetical protein